MGKQHDPQALFDGRSLYRALPFRAEWSICTV
jgi:hypothetical protein